jgi:NAD+ kinase
MANIVVLVNTLSKKNVLPLVKSVFSKHNIQGIYNIDSSDIKLAKNTDIIISIGGDGTVLKAIPLIYNTNISILSINSGDVGFLTNFNKNDIVSDSIANNKRVGYDIFLVKINNKDAGLFINELSINRDIQIGKAVRNKIIVNDNEYQEFYGDGIIVSSSLGSSGYALSCGGALVDTNLNTLQIVPIASHTNYKSPIILNANNSIIDIKTIVGKAQAFCDGKLISNNITSNSVITVQKSNKQVYFIKSDKNWISKVNEKLKLLC